MKNKAIKQKYRYEIMLNKAILKVCVPSKKKEIENNIKNLEEIISNLKNHL